MLSSCASLLDYQSARTVGEGNHELMVALTSNSVEEEGDESIPFAAPVAEWRYGLNNKLDIGFNLQPTTSLGVLGKYQFLGEEKDPYAFSFLGEAGYAYVIPDDNNPDYLWGQLDYKDWYFKAGVLGSYFINKDMSVTMGAKAVYPVSVDRPLYVHSFGFEVGRKVKLSLNAGYVLDWEEIDGNTGFELQSWQYGLGFRKVFNFSKKEEEPNSSYN